jgi:hypothetical protein
LGSILTRDRYWILVVLLGCAPLPNLVTVDGGLFGILARIKQIERAVGEDTITIESPARGPDALRRATVRYAEANRLRLVWDDVCVLEAGRGAVDGEEGEAVTGAGDAGARDDERLGVFLVLDLAEPGGAVGVRELEGLQVVEVEAAALESKGEVAGERGGGLA